MAIGIKKNAFTVSDVDTENQLADLKLIGSEFHERAIPWGRLVYEDEEDPTVAWKICYSRAQASVGFCRRNTRAGWLNATRS